MIAVDTNILIYAHREDSPLHKPAYKAIESLAEGHTAWGIPWPCMHEFLAIATHPSIYDPPTPMEAALDQVDAWLESPSIVFLGESIHHWQTLQRVLQSSRARGPRVHDARIAAVCLQHGVNEFWSADRDFSRFPELHVRNPCIG